MADIRKTAEAVVKRLLVGAEILGLRFAGDPDILFGPSDAVPSDYRQPYLKLESRWTVYPAVPERFPAGEEDLTELSRDKELQLICSLRGDVVTEVRIEEERCHLILTLRSGRVIFVNGYRDRFECWEVGNSWGRSGGFEDTWLVLGNAADGVDVVAPQWFKADVE